MNSKGTATAQMDPREHRIVVFGGPGVGKKTLCAKYFSPFPAYHYDPYGDVPIRKQHVIDEEEARVDVEDGPDEEFAAMREMWVKEGDGFVLQYSTADKGSVDRIKGLWEEIAGFKKSRNVPAVLVGNKCDLPDSAREVTYEEGERLAKEIGCPFFETSAKDGVNIEESFAELVRVIRRLMRAEEAKEQEKLREEEARSEAERKAWEKKASCCGGCVVL